MRVLVHLSTEHDSCLLFVSPPVLESFLYSDDAAQVRGTCGCLWKGSGQIGAPEPTEGQKEADETSELKEEMHDRRVKIWNENCFVALL